MIVGFYFRVGPTGGPHELVTVPPRRYPITGAALGFRPQVCEIQR